MADPWHALDVMISDRHGFACQYDCVILVLCLE